MAYQGLTGNVHETDGTGDDDHGHREYAGG